MISSLCIASLENISATGWASVDRDDLLARLIWPVPHGSLRGIVRMLTRKGKYGLKAMVDLAGLPEGQLAFVNDVATRNNIPKKFLDAILVELRNAGFVQSRKGKEGGYRLSRAAAEIRVGHIVRVLDGPLAPFACASRTRYERCEDCDENTCQVRHVMLDVRNAIAEVLDTRTLAEMRDLGQAELPKLVQQI